MFKKVRPMKSSSERRFVVLAIVLCSALGQARVAHAQAGVVVEEVSKGSAGERADIRAGDILLAWERSATPPANPENADGRFESAFDWMWLEIEQGPRGTVKVTGERDGRVVTFEVGLGSWGIAVRPRFNDVALNFYIAGNSAVAAKQLDQAVALWSEVLKSAEAASAAVLWMNLRIGDTWREARRWKEADTYYVAAREGSERARNVVAQGIVWDAMGSFFARQNKFADAEAAYLSAMIVRQNLWGESLSVARSLNNLGIVASSRGELPTAETHHKRALAIREKLAPGSLDVAGSLNNLGFVAWNRGDLTAADAYHKRALAIQENLAPDSLDVARSLNNLGLVVQDRGELAMAESYYNRALAIREKLEPDTLSVSRILNNLGNIGLNRGELATAESYYMRALSIQEKLAPDGLDVARSLNNLANVVRDRGDLATAESHYKRALAIREKLAPDSVELARTLNRLGILSRIRGDLAAAEFYYNHALAIREKLAPDSLDVSDSLNNLGTVAHMRGDLATAETYYRRSLAIKQKLTRDSFTVAQSLNNLGSVATDRGDLATAESHYKRALAIGEQMAPNSLELADFLRNLADVALKRGDLAKAEDYAKHSLAITAKLAPGSSDEAETLYGLGLIYRKSNQNRLAAHHLRRAVGALEAQIGKLGGTQEVQSGFGAYFADYYRNYIDLLIESNQAAEAFHILERSRARTLLAMLAERDLVFTADLPEQIERERRRIAWEYDQTQAQLALLNPMKEQAQVEHLLNRTRELRESQSQIVEQIRRKSPWLASLQYPQALDLKGVQALLDPGTLLLSYSIGKEKSYLFALRSDAGVQVYMLPIGESQLREEIESFRRLIQRAHLGSTDLKAPLKRGTHLYDLLIQPAAKLIEKAQRVLFVPDGPLHVLPFAALVRGVDKKPARVPRDWQYLVEWKPLHVVVSATVYSELRKGRQSRAIKQTGKTLIAFGDPKYPASAHTEDEKELNRRDAVVRSMLTRGYRFKPLPATKSEVSAIAELYRKKAAIYVGEAATEERAKRVAKEAKYLHFASHGVLDERFPLNSGLALTIPNEVKQGEDNGILQAWEIFEGVRIDADLVVLSACETALGKEMGGEGLVGLTRAFEYAGARSVVASLWSVADETTAALMKRFYGYLKAGRSKDTALRQAQLDLINGSISIPDPHGRATKLDASHPFYWAAFQVHGDWR
jgi:CHAT domain-containing protein/Tfp pilus assembly protein PilF